MNRRLLGLVLLAGALAAQLALARPAREELWRSFDEQRVLREERRSVERRAAASERRVRLQDAAFARLGARGGGATAQRAALLENVRPAGLDQVRLSVRPGPRGTAFSVAATGSIEGALRYAGDVSAPGAGVALARLRLEGRGQDVALTLDGQFLGARP
ncbi:MAG: hypothetical protein AB7O37_21420 [Vicinamibacteria bacterium]